MIDTSAVDGYRPASGHATNLIAADLARENERLRARIAQLEAEKAALVPQIVAVGALMVDLTSGEVIAHGQVATRLTGRERALLAEVAAGRGRPVSYYRIGRAVWPHSSDRDRTRMIRVNLSRLREKIDIHGQYLQTVPCIGLRLVAP